MLKSSRIWLRVYWQLNGNCLPIYMTYRRTDVSSLSLWQPQWLDCGLHVRGVVVRFPSRVKRFLIFIGVFRLALGPTQSPSDADVKEGWSYTSTSAYGFTACSERFGETQFPDLQCLEVPAVGLPVPEDGDLLEMSTRRNIPAGLCLH